jgi:predicted ArsR family transcriptional regulator
MPAQIARCPKSLDGPDTGGKHRRVRKSPRKSPGRSALAVAGELKRSGGLPVGELAERMGMSYMGVKAHCLALEKSGHAVSRSTHNGTGRPFLCYRLTELGHGLFDRGESRLAASLLDSARVLFGPAAADKLLFHHFQKLAAAYAEKIPASATDEEKLAALARIRESEGTMPSVGDGALVEAHSPLARIFASHPAAVAMEEAALSKALGRKVTRTAEPGGGRVRFG